MLRRTRVLSLLLPLAFAATAAGVPMAQAVEAPAISRTSVSVPADVAPLLIDPIATVSIKLGEAMPQRTVGTNDPAAKVTVTGLPAGVSFDPVAWNITGTPTKSGVSTVTAKVVDRFGRTNSTSFTISVEGPGTPVPPSDVAPLLVDPIANVSLNLGEAMPLRTVGSNDPAAKVTVSGLPKGVSFDPVSWNITGTPKVTGTYQVKATVLDRFGRSVSTSFTIKVEGPATPAKLAIEPIPNPWVVWRPGYDRPPISGSFYPVPVRVNDPSATIRVEDPRNVGLLYNQAERTLYLPSGYLTITNGDYPITVIATNGKGEEARESFTIITCRNYDECNMKEKQY